MEKKFEFLKSKSIDGLHISFVKKKNYASAPEVARHDFPRGLVASPSP